MNWTNLHPILSLAALLTLFGFLYRHETKQKKIREERLEHCFGGRPSLDDTSFHQRFFADTQYPAEMVSKIRRIFQEPLDMIDLSKLQADDDLSRDFSVLWDLDSMASVDIVVGIEKAFDIKITDPEAEGMKTFRKVVECVYQKVQQKGLCEEEP